MNLMPHRRRSAKAGDYQEKHRLAAVRNSNITANRRELPAEAFTQGILRRRAGTALSLIAARRVIKERESNS
jgi:hypothetical protein